MRLITLMVCICTLSSCGMVVGSPSGLREVSHWTNGLVTTGKASPDVDTAYHKTERERENQWTIRMMPIGRGES